MRTKAPLTVSLLVFLLAACAGTWSAVKSSAWPAAGGAAGAVVGSAAGPAGTVAGAAIGAGCGHLIGENAALRSGELQGEGAADAEAERWKGEAHVATHAASLLRTILWCVAGYIAWLRREWILRALKGPNRGASLLHAVFAGPRTRPK